MRNRIAQVRMAAAGGALAALLSGCASQSSMGPSPVPSTPAPSVPVQHDELTVRVLTRLSETPIAGAAVQADKARAVTDASGIAVINVVAGEELEVNVSAAGYEPMTAAAVLGPSERWTFYLQPLN